MRRAKATKKKDAVFKYFDELDMIMVKYDLNHKLHLTFSVGEMDI